MRATETIAVHLVDYEVVSVRVQRNCPVPELSIEDDEVNHFCFPDGDDVPLYQVCDSGDHCGNWEDVIEEAGSFGGRSVLLEYRDGEICGAKTTAFQGKVDW